MRTSIDFASVSRLHRALIAQQDDHGRQRTDKASPTLVRKDVREHGATLANPGAIRGNGGRHGVVSAHTDAEDNAPYGEPNEGAGGGEVASGVGDGHDGGEDDEHELFAVDGFAAEVVCGEA